MKVRRNEYLPLGTGRVSVAVEPGAQVTLSATIQRPVSAFAEGYGPARFVLWVTNLETGDACDAELVDVVVGMDSVLRTLRLAAEASRQTLSLAMLQRLTSIGITLRIDWPSEVLSPGTEVRVILRNTSGHVVAASGMLVVWGPEHEVPDEPEPTPDDEDELDVVHRQLVSASVSNRTACGLIVDDTMRTTTFNDEVTCAACEDQLTSRVSS